MSDEQQVAPQTEAAPQAQLALERIYLKDLSFEDYTIQDDTYSINKDTSKRIGGYT